MCRSSGRDCAKITRHTRTDRHRGLRPILAVQLAPDGRRQGKARAALRGSVPPPRPTALPPVSRRFAPWLAGRRRIGCPELTPMEAAPRPLIRICPFNKLFHFGDAVSRMAWRDGGNARLLVPFGDPPFCVPWQPDFEPPVNQTASCGGSLEDRNMETEWGL